MANEHVNKISSRYVLISTRPRRRILGAEYFCRVLYIYTPTVPNSGNSLQGWQSLPTPIFSALELVFALKTQCACGTRLPTWDRASAIHGSLPTKVVSMYLPFWTSVVAELSLAAKAPPFVWRRHGQKSSVSGQWGAVTGGKGAVTDKKLRLRDLKPTPKENYGPTPDIRLKNVTIDIYPGWHTPSLAPRSA